MSLCRISSRGSFGKCLICYLLPTHEVLPNFNPYWNRGNVKMFIRTPSRQQLACCHRSEELCKKKDDRKLLGVEFLGLMESSGIIANSQTFIWALDRLLKLGTFSDCKKLHAKILKLGFGNDRTLCEKLMDSYCFSGELDAVMIAFDDICGQNVVSWNKLLAAFLANKMSFRVVQSFLTMTINHVVPTEVTFAYVLKACAADSMALHCLEQIHAKIIFHGLGFTPDVCNPLIDSYAKNGFIFSASKVFQSMLFHDSVSWLAMIAGFSQNGYEREAVDLFCKMHFAGLCPTPYVFSSILSACSKAKLWGISEQLHCLALKWGFALEIYVCNALVTMYSRIGDFISAESVFSRMHFKDEVSYNSLIAGLSQLGYSEKALQLFEKMQIDCLRPDCVTVASLLSACASTGSLCKGEQLHSFAIKSGMYADTIIEGSLLDLYVKTCDVNVAQKFFDTVQTTTVVLCNVMLVAYGLYEDIKRSLKMLRKMQIQDLMPNQFTYPGILRTCTSIGEIDLGEQIHTQVVKMGYQYDAYVCSVLIDMYAKLGKFKVALGILKRFAVEDVVSWTAMMSGYIQNGLFIEALTLFKESLNRGIHSDSIGYSSALSSCAGLQSLSLGQQIHAYSIVAGCSYDLSVGNTLVSMYARCGKTEEAYVTFKRIDCKDSISWNGLISGFADSGLCEEALNVLTQMVRGDVEPNFFTFGSAVSAAANLANINQGNQLHSTIVKKGFGSEIEVCNTLISLYSKCGSIGDALRKFSEMPNKSDISWNAMITAYSQHGYGNEAVKLFEEMKNAGEIPNHATFVGVLSACSHAGLVDLGVEYFESMARDHALTPKIEHYVCVVDMLARKGLLIRARKFIEEMIIKPDVMIWRVLLSACAVHKNKEVGEYAAQRLLQMNPDDSATYVLLSNMYAVTRNWNSRDRTRQMMKERGIRKDPGSSWIEIKNIVHSFYVGDRLHPMADKIYDFLADLNGRAVDMGYIQDQYNLLNDADQWNKDPTAFIHSEKLAVSFGLLSLPDSMPIRVMKNLRVCNDCHTWMKYISKVANREIVVRDSYRFHHFLDGACSCKDYW